MDLRGAMWETMAAMLLEKIEPHEYAKLCMINPAWYRVFMPHLWRDPLKLIFKGRGLENESRLRDFWGALAKASPATRDMVKILDFRHAHTRGATNKYSSLVEVRNDGPNFVWLRGLRFLIIDGTDFHVLPKDKDFFQPLVIISALGCCRGTFESSALPSRPLVYQLLYLDLSYSVSGQDFCQQRSHGFPNLRILKLRSTGLIDFDLECLFRKKARQLWSLDIRDNKLTDKTWAELRKRFVYERHRGAHTDTMRANVELTMLCASVYFREIPQITIEQESGGHIMMAPAAHQALCAGRPRDLQYANMMLEHYFLTRMTQSTHKHLLDKDRYYPDPPPYEGELEFYVPEFRPDTTDDIIKWYDEHPTEILNYPYVKSVLSDTPLGLTHLYVSGNNMSTKTRFLSHQNIVQSLDIGNPWQVEREQPNGYLVKHPIQKQVGDCNEINYLGFCNSLPYNLEILRIHHSFITQTNTTTTHEGDSPEDTDKLIRYLVFRPNQNPRLRELTLVDVPRKSLGLVIDSLKFLIHHAADQEWHLQRMQLPQITQNYSKRVPSPKLFPGLRKITLEFESARKNSSRHGRSVTGDADADEYAAHLATDFSFFSLDDAESDVRQGIKCGDAESVLGQGIKSDDAVLDVRRELRAFRERTRKALIRSPHWGGELLFVVDGGDPVSV